MAGSLTARAITCGSPTLTPTLDGFSGPWSLAIASMAPPPIGSRAAKPEGTPSAGLAAARQALRRLDTLARLKTGGLNGC